MATATSQARWRANQTSKRIEVNLPVDTVTELDALAANQGQSRATVIANLIADTQGAEAATEAADTEPATTPEPEPETQTSAPQAAESRPDTQQARYTFRRPRENNEQRYKWVAETPDGTCIGLGADPVRFHKWRGVILDGSLYLKETKGSSRDKVVTKLLERI